MSRRVTVILDDDVIKKLRILQAKMIKDSNRSVSFSKVVNHTASKHFK